MVQLDLFSRGMGQKIVATLFLATLLASCNESEFYEKEFLSAGDLPDETKSTVKPGNNGGSGISGGSNNGGNNGNSGNGGTNGGNGGSGSNGGSGGSGSNGGAGNNGGNNNGNGGSGGVTNGGGNVGVCGTGTLTPMSDSFIQNVAVDGKVDILWVIDNSGSMQDEQDDIARNFSIFVQEFIQKNIDFRMAITTTDARSNFNGRMVGDWRKLTTEAAQNDEQQFIDDFKNMIRVGTRGSGSERGLHTGSMFMDRYSNSWNRRDAFLAVVVVSDEEDQSSGIVQSYVNQIRAHKLSGGLAKIYSIVTTELGRRRWETVGNRYMNASNITGGTIANIHNDFYSTLRDLGGTILDLLDSFPLSGIPLNSTISVEVDNVAATSGWTYDPVARVLRFDSNNIPDAGSIVIAYYEQCL